MTRLISLLLWLSLATTAQARCTGTDLSHSLLADEAETVASRMADTPYATGNHWIAEREGEVLHLIGTMHISDPRLDGPTERLTPLLDDAALLLMEMNAADMQRTEQTILTNPDTFMIKGPSLPDLLPQDDWERLGAALQARGMPPFMGARMKPWYISMMLSMPPCMLALAGEKDGLDFRLERAAATRGVPTQSLEPIDTFFRLFEEIDQDTQLAMLRSALTGPEASEDLLETMLTAYFDESAARGQYLLEAVVPRLSGINTAENEAIAEAMQTKLLADRNRAWLPVLLDALSRTDGPVIAAFGAAHLSGKDGVLRLLEDEGFALTRAPF